MSNLKHSLPIERRNTCQAYVDDSAKFVGQQQGWGVVFAGLAATSVTAGAAVSNSESGGAWSENKKTVLITAAVPTAVLAYNFLSNASSASTSAASASLALAEKDDDVMWAGCERARAAYWDGRTAGIAAVSSNLSKAQGTPTTPQARENAGNLDAAVAAAEKAANAAASAKKDLEAAAARKDPTNAVNAGVLPHYAAAKTAAEDAQKASDNANAAVIALKDAAAKDDMATVRAKRNEAESAGDTAKTKLDTVRAELLLY